MGVFIDCVMTVRRHNHTLRGYDTWYLVGENLTLSRKNNVTLTLIVQKLLLQQICTSRMKYSMGNYLSNRILFLIFCMSVIFLINYQSSYVFTENMGVIQRQTQVYRAYYFETSYDVIF